MKKIIISWIIGMTVIGGSVYAANNHFPTISATFTEDSITKTLFSWDSEVISLKDIVKNLSEITDSNNTITYSLKNTDEKYFSYDEENKNITISETTPAGKYELTYEVCTEGKKVTNTDELDLPTITFVPEVQIEDEE